MSKLIVLRGILSNNVKRLHDSALIKLQEIFQPWQLDERKIAMATRDEFDKDKLFEVALFHLFEQNLELSAGILRQMMELFDRPAANFADANRQTKPEQILAEILFASTKLSADLLFKSFTHPNQRPADPIEYKKRLDEKFENEQLRRLFNSIDYATFPFEINLEEENLPGAFSTTGLRAFLKQDAVVHAVSTVINECLELTEEKKISGDGIKEYIDHMSVYTCSKMAGFSGVTLRNGILICLDTPNIEKGQRRLASIYCTAVHELCHFADRMHFNDYDFDSPSSNLAKGAPKRLTPQFSDIPLELGYAAECQLCRFVIDWQYVCGEEPAKNFFLRAASMKHSPIFESETDFCESGMRKDYEPPLAFMAKKSFGTGVRK